MERRFNLVLKGMNLMLFTEPEEVSSRERKEIEKRFRQYVAGKNSEFVELKSISG